ncbi:MAG: hypothetical protein L0Z50_20060 [Verrucomicrobiales bacterium]|nr:hypothetical protein [Verrucomicrobiales bacterium]
MISDNYDGTILRTDHNGLILQAYLGLSGLRTLFGPPRSWGCGLRTAQDRRHAGFWHNPYSSLINEKMNFKNSK